MALPVVNLKAISLLLNESEIDEQTWYNIGKELVANLTDCGCIYLISHGVDKVNFNF